MAISKSHGNVIALKGHLGMHFRAPLKDNATMCGIIRKSKENYGLEQVWLIYGYIYKISGGAAFIGSYLLKVDDLKHVSVRDTSSNII